MSTIRCSLSHFALLLVPVPDYNGFARGTAPGTNHQATGAPLVGEAKGRRIARQPPINVPLRKDLFRRVVSERESAGEFS